MQSSPYDWIQDSLKVIHRAHWHRSVKRIESSEAQTAEICIEGHSVINFGSNDYLGLSTHPNLKAAAIKAIHTYGTGATGSRLTSGQRPIHQELETAIAQWKQTEAALVFSSGYLANLSTIQALVGPRDLILGDRYNHSSLKNGAKLSGATVLEFEHNSIPDLRTLLQTHRPQSRRCLITVDAVFSMDGDLCNLKEIATLAQQHQAMLLIDEAHASGVLGKTGSGLLEHLNLSPFPLIRIGTLSKALGSLGGYVAGSEQLIDFLRNRAAGWIYTTGLSPADCGAALAAIEICQQQPQHHQRLWQNVESLTAGLDQLLLADQHNPTFLRLPSESAIVCLVMDKPQTALDVSQTLLEQGFFVPAIRPPTVPTSRLRFSLMATHTSEQINALLKAIAFILKP